MTQTYKIAILGASGYTGAELVRLITTHPNMEIAALTADRKAGQRMGDVFPHLAHLDLPDLITMEDLDFDGIDLVFAALPHGLTQEVVAGLPETVKVVDLSADFRLRDPAVYKKWYGLDHKALKLQKEVAYGLPEFYRDAIKSARVTANTGCYVATGLLPLMPLLAEGVIDPEDIIIDAASGTTGAGRAPKEGTLFTEVSEGFQAYGVGNHRHMGELDQELSVAAGKAVTCSFTPHLLPQNRGILATIYLKGDAERAFEVLSARYEKEPFVYVLPMGQTPATRHVRGSNLCRIGVVADRRPGRIIIVSALDNLMKGSSGQAVQNANLMLGLPETAGLELAPVFP
ncbi:MAG TPA: N-acetyl-gamma-glutamyl-phosphate reductase [Paracoccaceae bacterium]|nr:N-acetyl-gamma-glutamyl-phosphate reductase [Paracoccaceae bacterium]